MRIKPNKAFSLVELSIVILIIGVLIAAVGQGIDLLQDARLTAARMMTQSSRVNSIKNLVTWLETTSENSFDAVEAVDDSTVTNWYDINPQSTAKNNAQQTTAGNKPRYVANCINNLPCLDFDGTNDYMDSVLAIGNTSGGLSVFAVVKFDAIVNGDNAEFSVVGSGTTWGSGTAFNLKVWDSSPAAIYYQLPEQVIGAIPQYAPAISNINYLIEALNSSTTTAIWVNKVAGTSYSGVPMTNIATLNIGSFNNGGSRARYLNGKIAELIIYDRLLATKERLSIESYLSNKWKF